MRRKMYRNVFPKKFKESGRGTDLTFPIEPSLFSFSLLKIYYAGATLSTLPYNRMRGDAKKK